MTGRQLSPPRHILSPPLLDAERVVGTQVRLLSTSGVPVLVDLPPMPKGAWAVTWAKYSVPPPLLGLAVEREGASLGSAKETLALDKSLTLCTGYYACKAGGGVLPDLPRSAGRMLNGTFRRDQVVGWN